MVREILPRVKEFIEAHSLVVLRDKKGMALDVSYSIDGLRWACQANGRSRFYENGLVSSGRILSMNKKPLQVREDLIIEKFIPTDKATEKLQSAEFTCIHKAYKLLYSQSSPS